MKTNARVLRALFAITAVAAGPLTGQQLSFGIKTGVNYATLTGADAGAATDLATTGFGGFALVQWRSTLALSAEALYMQKGADVVWESVDGQMEVDYLEFPLLLRTSPPRRVSRLLPYVLAGPALSFAIGCRVKPRDAAVESISCDEPGMGFSPKGFDLGIAGGAGIEYVFERAALSMEARYAYGLTKMEDNGTDLHNSVVSILLGVRVKTRAAPPLALK